MKVMVVLAGVRSSFAGVRSSTVAWRGEPSRRDRWGWVAQVSGCCSAVIVAAAAGVVSQPVFASDCHPRAGKVEPPPPSPSPRAHFTFAQRTGRRRAVYL